MLLFRFAVKLLNPIIRSKDCQYINILSNMQCHLPHNSAGQQQIIQQGVKRFFTPCQSEFNPQIIYVRLP